MRKARLILLAGLGTALAVTGPGMSSADPGTTAVNGAVVHTADAPEPGYWTAERMREATPLDLLEATPADLSGEVPTGDELTVSPTDGHVSAVPEGGGPWTGGGDVVTTAGRVFFTMDGRNASCSGNAVTSTNKSTVITAGHCVKYQGTWHTNWTFVPGYHDGQSPWGQWTATETLTTPQWEASEDMNFDVGAAVVAPLNGKLLTDLVGGQGLKFNGAYNQVMYSFGFPAADPYDGSKFIYCSGTAFKDFLLTQDHGLSCDMTGGSSGGPWFYEFNESTGTGLQGSVNSFGYVFLPGTMFGPHFGTDAQNLYNTAQS
ncbi:trypsin-like serine peptidase [Stackebrandtia soli]|uniref:trypsin-like serine peptidase n=1 Tax=Stackebrandtia soli TaxID=1892856 RepID=UPI0039E91B40